MPKKVKNEEYCFKKLKMMLLGAYKTFIERNKAYIVYALKIEKKCSGPSRTLIWPRLLGMRVRCYY